LLLAVPSTLLHTPLPALSPYTTLFRSLEHMPGIRPVPLFIKNAAVRFFNRLEERHVTAVLSNMGRIEVDEALQPYIRRFSAFSRSEEHTSELQSRFDLVCRLLLEKKKI